MNFFCIADKGSSIGFKLAGFEVREASGRREALEALAVALATPAVGIIIVTEQLSSQIREEIDEHIYNKETPLILEIPSMSGAGSEKRKTIGEFVKEAIGISI